MELAPGSLVRTKLDDVYSFQQIDIIEDTTITRQLHNYTGENPTDSVGLVVASGFRCNTNEVVYAVFPKTIGWVWIDTCVEVI